MNPGLMNLPGADFIDQGIQDLKNSRLTIPALLVCIGKPRLESAGFHTPPHSEFVKEPELKLYALIIQEGYLDPYSYYNALLRRLISFAQALEQL